MCLIWQPVCDWDGMGCIYTLQTEIFIMKQCFFKDISGFGETYMPTWETSFKWAGKVHFCSGHLKTTPDITNSIGRIRFSQPHFIIS